MIQATVICAVSSQVFAIIGECRRGCSEETAKPHQRDSGLCLVLSRHIGGSPATGSGIRGWTLVADNLAAAILLGLVVFVYERHRERELMRRLQVIELMNHHVRNALQPVMYLPYSGDQQQQLNMIREAVHRIDWALREILPGSTAGGPPSSDAAA